MYFIILENYKFLHTMFNNYLFLQLIILFILFFIYWVLDFYNLIILGIFYLFLFSLLVLYNDLDILISFLLIIDLGVFLILFAFLLHFNKFLTYKNIYDVSYKNLFIFINSIFFFLIFIYFNNFFIIYNFNKIIEYTWFFFISFLDFYYIYNVIIYSDMHLLKEIYFHINSYEFVLISFFLIIGIFILYFLINFLINFVLKSTIVYNKNLKIFNINTSLNFFKIQNYNKQINTSASSRVWYQLNNDFKTNNTISNR